MMKLCEYTTGNPFSGIKYIPNNESRAIAVNSSFGVCILEVRRENITLLSSCLSLGINL